MLRLSLLRLSVVMLFGNKHVNIPTCRIAEELPGHVEVAYLYM